MSEIVFQGEPTECGLASLAMVSKIQKCNIAIEQFREQAILSSSGISMENLSDLADKFKMAHNIIQFNPEDVTELTCPAIIHFGGNHYVVLKKITRSHVLILNPAVGEQIMPLAVFKDRISGYGMIFNPEGYPSDTAIIKKTPRKGMNYSVILLGFVILGINMAIPVVFIDSDHIAENITLFIAAFIGIQILLYACSRKLNLTRKQMQINEFNQSGESLCNSLLKNKLHFFERRIASDTRGKFQAFITACSSKVNFLNDYVISTISALICVGIMIYLNILLAVITVGMLVLTGMITLIFKSRIESAYSGYQESALELGNHVLLLIKGIMSIKSAGAEGKISRLYSFLSHKYTRFQSFITDQEFNQRIFSQITFNTEMVIVFIVSFSQISAGNFKLEHMMAYMFVRQIFIQSAENVFAIVMGHGRINIDLKRGDDIRNFEKETEVPLAIVSFSGVRYQRLEYRYHCEQKPLFTLDDLAIEQGERLLIRGKSGSGKSTLLKVMSGLYRAEPAAVISMGKIAVDDNLLRSLTYYHEAENIFFPASILENITLFDPAPDVEHCTLVLQQLGLWDAIMSLSNRLHEVVNEEVHPFSFGQKKRLLLCRALCSKKPMLLLDEPTSNLDIESAECVQTALRDSPKTIIIATHDDNLSTLADRTIYLG